jgi:hypothetical protein
VTSDNHVAAFYLDLNARWMFAYVAQAGADTVCELSIACDTNGRKQVSGVRQDPFSLVTKVPQKLKASSTCNKSGRRRTVREHSAPACALPRIKEVHRKRAATHADCKEYRISRTRKVLPHLS